MPWRISPVQLAVGAPPVVATDTPAPTTITALPREIVARSSSASPPVSTIAVYERGHTRLHEASADGACREPRGPADGPDLIALNLVYVTAAGPTGAQLLIPALRVPLAAVARWSVVDFGLPKQPSGSGVAVGVAVLS